MPGGSWKGSKGGSRLGSDRTGKQRQQRRVEDWRGLASRGWASPGKAGVSGFRTGRGLTTHGVTANGMEGLAAQVGLGFAGLGMASTERKGSIGAARLSWTGKARSCESGQERKGCRRTAWSRRAASDWLGRWGGPGMAWSRRAAEAEQRADSHGTVGMAAVERLGAARTGSGRRGSKGKSGRRVDGLSKERQQRKVGAARGLARNVDAGMEWRGLAGRCATGIGQAWNGQAAQVGKVGAGQGLTRTGRAGKERHEREDQGRDHPRADAPRRLGRVAKRRVRPSGTSARVRARASAKAERRGNRRGDRDDRARDVPGVPGPRA